jgi:hypothetical protein
MNGLSPLFAILSDLFLDSLLLSRHGLLERLQNSVDKSLQHCLGVIALLVPLTLHCFDACISI